MEMVNGHLSVRLYNGFMVAAKMTKHGLTALTYANRKQANVCVEAFGDEWSTVKFGRPFYAVHLPSGNE